MIRLYAFPTGCKFQFIGLTLQISAATLDNLNRVLRQSGEESIHFLAHLSSGTKTDVRRDIFADPIPNSLVWVEIWAIAGQSHEAQLELRRGEIGTHCISMMGWPIIPDHNQRFR